MTMHIFYLELLRKGIIRTNKVQFTMFFNRQDIFFQETRFFTWIRFNGPFQMIFIRPVSGFSKNQFILIRILWISFYSTSAMIKVKMRKENIRYIFGGEATFP